MLGIPFALETVPVADAEREMARLRAERPGTHPVLLGDADIFSTEWAEGVDRFAPPEDIVAAAREIDIDAWFSARASQVRYDEAASALPLRPGSRGSAALRLPFEVALWPIRGLKRLGFGADSTSGVEVQDRRTTRPPADAVAALHAQLAELELAGDDPEALDEMRAVVAEVERDIARGRPPVFPDPIDYVCPRTGDTVAAAILRGRAPWEGAAWLQHGTFAAIAPLPVLVAHCKWLWDRHGAAILTASTDHIGFEVARPIFHSDEARDVLDRFIWLGASEVNADARGSSGASLIGAHRWWVWWD